MNANSLRAILFAAACALSENAEATTYDFSSVAQGWLTQYGASNGTFIGNDYAAGNCGESDCSKDAGELRDFFEFDVAGLIGPVTSADLVLYTGEDFFVQSPTITYQVTSLSALTFANLGNGTLYGSRTYTASDNDLTEGISLDAAALSTIAAGGIFGVSGRVISPTDFGASQSTQLVFGDTGFPSAHLVVNPTPVPEPSIWAMFLIGFGALGFMMRRFRRNGAVAAA